MSRTPHILLATVSMLAASISMATAAVADNIKQAAEQAAAGRYIIKYKAAVNTTGLRTENKAGKNAALQQLQASSALLQQKHFLCNLFIKCTHSPISNVEVWK